MARLIDYTTVEAEPEVAGFQVIEFVEESPAEMDVFTVSPRKTAGARLDRSFEVFEWFEY